MGMRNRPGQSPEEEPEVNLTPMLDVVFIMLIFFIVTASFVKEAGIQVDRPAAKTAVKASANILVAISKTGEIWIQKQQVDIRQVRANLERLLNENPKSGIVIQADSKSKNGILVDVADQAKLAGVTDIVVAALEDQ